MSLIAVLGWLAAVSGPLTSLPQLLRLVRARTSAGLSLLMWQLQAGALLGWAVHGYHLGYANIVVPNLVSLVGALLVLRTIAGDRGLHAPRLAVPAVVIAAVLAAVEYAAPSSLFGFAAMLPLALGGLSQAADLVRTPDVSGISPAFLAMNWLTQALWLSWGILAGDAAIMVCAGVLGVLATLTLGLAAARSSGRLRPPDPRRAAATARGAG